MKSKKALPYSALVIGGLVSLTGITCVVMYVLEAIVARVGEADQSLLFWYLPILFMGLIGIIIGVVIGVWGIYRLRKLRQENTSPDN
jgi:hypothetical protein